MTKLLKSERAVLRERISLAGTRVFTPNHAALALGCRDALPQSRNSTSQSLPIELHVRQKGKFMKTVSNNLVAPRFLTAAIALAALAVSTCASQPPVEMITPAQWLQRQPKPIFKPGHTLPRLTRYGWSLRLDTNVELTENWHYALQLPTYLSDEDRVLDVRIKDPNDEVFKIVALTNSNPAKYPLATILSRSEPPNPAPETFLRDAEGKLLSGNTYSPLNPQITLDQMAELRARPLRELRKKVPINIILNGGEYGLGVPGFMRQHAEKDPAVAAAQAKSGLDWISFISRAKGREMDTIAAAVRKAVPDRRLYIYYATGPADRNRYGGWRDWGMDPEDALKGSDLPATEYYYKHFNSGYLPDAGGNDILTRTLNAVGFQIKHGKKYSYDWLSGGWADEADPNAPPPVAAPAPAPVPDKPVANAGETRVLSNNNAAALVDPNAGGVSPNSLYTGFLKCIFTAGTLAGNAGYYQMPGGGFDGTFPADRPKNYLPQMTALSHVQALFSHLESDVRYSDLLPGPGMHRWTTDQPAFEFPTGTSGVRVLARKHKTQNKWLITAWAADGLDRPVKVTIPDLGQIKLLARAAGSVYTATLANKSPQLTLNDPDAMLPTVKGFAPKKVTTAQTLASFKAPVAPQMQDLLAWFDAAKSVEKDEKNAVLSWKPQGSLADWEVASSTEGKLPAYANRRPPMWVADAGNGLPAVRFGGNGASLMSRKLKPEAGLKEAAMTIFAVYSSSVPQEDMSQNGNNNSLFRVPSGSGISNGPWPNPAKQTWQMQMAVQPFKDSPEYIVIGSGFWGAEHIASTFYFSGDIAELLVYRGDLPTAQKVQAELYLNAKYKLRD